MREGSLEEHVRAQLVALEPYQNIGSLRANPLGHQFGTEMHTGRIGFILVPNRSLAQALRVGSGNQDHVFIVIQKMKTTAVVTSILEN